MASLDAVLTKHKGLGPGFDFLRIGLASSIVLTHAFLLTGNQWLLDTPYWFIDYALVPMFFALSGFLVSGSAQRLSLGNFLINRGLRIVPALGVDIFVCALVIGPIMTTVPLAQYFSSPDFFKYFLNITGWIHYHLPGVFKTQPNDFVNGALWTVPYELFCYVVMSGLIITRWVKRPAQVAILAFALYAVGIIVEKEPHWFPSGVLPTAQFLFTSRGAGLLSAFLCGTLAYQLRTHIPYSWKLFAACCAVCLITAVMLHVGIIHNVANRILLVPTLTYMTAFLGLTPIPVPKIVRSGDYSYGVYLYHDPLLHVIIALAPSVVFIRGYGALALFALGLPAVALMATFSWHVVEKRILALRKRFSFVARVRGVAKDGDVTLAPAPAPADKGDFVGDTSDASETGAANASAPISG